MTRAIGGICLLLAGALSAASAEDPSAEVGGKWRTSLGVVSVTPEGEKLAATFESPGFPKIQGTLQGKSAKFSAKQGATRSEAEVTFDDGGRSFHGWFQSGNGFRNAWNGWRPDPTAAKGETAKFDGPWLTTLGLMELNQDGTRVRGRFALRGNAEIEGDVKGRHLDVRFRAFQPGKGWFELLDSGKTLAGAAVDDGFHSWFAWNGRKAPEFPRHVRLIAGKTVDGSTNGLLTYHVRAPEGFVEGDGKTRPAIVLLHGSNMNARSYVETFAAVWPDLARTFLLLGINGERPSDIGPDPRFNYSYVNYVGKSTFGGYPGTDRESPALVAEALTELKRVYAMDHYLVGGHSQGGFLTYSLLMNFPSLVAGAFPISGAVIFQCEPDAYADEGLRDAQRLVPLAIVHGKTDPMVGFDSAQYASNLFGEADWRALRLFASEDGAHMFARLPVGEAVGWLEALTSDDPEGLLTFAEARVKAGETRDALAALHRLESLTPNKTQSSRARRLSDTIDDQARAGARDLLPRVRENKDGAWIDDFLAYRDRYEFAPGAADVMKAFAKLRERHKAPAQEAFNAARTAFQQGKPDEGYARYQEIVDRYYAAPLYRNVKVGLASRKK